jgi:hypothetical protein
VCDLRDTILDVWQLDNDCMRLLGHDYSTGIFLEIISFCLELVKVAPARLRLLGYLRAAGAMMGLQKLDQAEETLHEALALCEAGDGLWLARVS